MGKFQQNTNVQLIKNPFPLQWVGKQEQLTFDLSELVKMLLNNSETIYAVQMEGAIGFTTQPIFALMTDSEDSNVVASVPAVPVDHFGDPGFLHDYGVRAAY